MEKGASSHRRDIQGLRAVAVLLVIGAHAHLTGLSGGFVGVDVFFVISGYVITASLLKESSETRSRRWARFYAQRIARIVPAATVTLVATLLAARAFLGAAFAPTLPSDARWAALFGVNIHFAHGAAGYFVPGQPASLVTQFWSLSVEEQFYLLWPLVVLGLLGATRRLTRSTFKIVVGAVIVVSALFAWRLTTTNAVAAYYSTWARMGEFAVGGFVAASARRRFAARPGWSAVWGALGLALIGVSATTFSSDTPYPSWRVLIPVCGTALVIWTGECQVSHGPTYFLSRDPLVYLGDISYSLYLFHFAWLALPLELSSPWNFDGAPTIETMAAIAMAAVSYRFIEQPFRQAQWLRNDPLAALLFAACCGALVWDVSIWVA